ncbi:GALNT14 [Symbiodinium natans]|uniref:GALNT14 protein n=1 Tax=Symbiodinium natans TaxID=878477 RepID=A0A812I9R0_9DINO|nr:GALNT14 [Symbiodinium natans]
MAGPGPGKALLVRDILLLLLLFAVPTGAFVYALDRTLAATLVASSLISLAIELYRQRKRCLPYPVYLVLVYAVQILCCLSSLHSSLSLEGPTGQHAATTISIVMAAHNEHEYLKRTLDSIIDSTPLEVLTEIILVDDGSSPPLASLVSSYSLVKLLRHESRRGLIKSKTEGGNSATGDVIMFLDAHVRPVPGWHAPLLRHIGQNYKRVVVPLIPILNADTWEVNNNAIGVKMMFDWTLFFNWFEDGNDIVPCMSGGLFAIAKRWWHESGEYDYGMNMWGAENIEQSIRIWLCGGEIFVARDSRVAHVFRRSFPYAVNNTEVYINKVRTVETWFDDYKRFFYAADPAAERFVDAMGDISDRQALKKQLNCKPFSWYVTKFKDVFETKNMLPKDMFLIRDTGTGLCLQPERRTSRLLEGPCRQEDKRLRWTYTNKGRSLEHVDTEMCLDADSAQVQKVGAKVLLYRCMQGSPMQEWVFKNGHLRFANLCVNGSAEGDLAFARCGNFLQERGPFEPFDQKAMGPLPRRRSAG